MENFLDFKNIIDPITFLLDSKSVIFFALDLQGNILYANKAYSNILSYEEKNIAKKLINPSLKSLINENPQKLVFEGFLTLHKEESNSSFHSKVYRERDALLFICEYDSAEIEDLYKKMSVSTSKINNMNRTLLKTQFNLKSTIQELKETQAMLIHSEKMNALGQLVAGIAHEINNPIAYVIGNIQIIQDYFNSINEFIGKVSCDDEIPIKDLNTLYDIEYILSDLPDLQESTLDGAQRVSKIVAALRNYSRIDSSERVVCNIQECIESALTIASTELKNKQIELVLNLEETTDIPCYPAQLNQVLLNMIVNGIGAVEKQGTITIALYEKDSNILIEIEDNGCGIPEENKDKIYDAFFTTKPPGMGQGLGLNIVYKIITDMHHGSIKLNSTTNLGTKFTIALLMPTVLPMSLVF